MSGFRVISVDKYTGTMVVDWGGLALNHYIPGEIVGAQSVDSDRLFELIEAMRPVSPEPVDVPDALLSLVYQAPAEVVERSWRDMQLTSLLFMRDRHRDEVELGIATTLTAGQFVELLGYIQQLRDWPQSELFPAAEHRPSAPEWYQSGE